MDTRIRVTDTAGGIDMVFVKVREVYDLHTTKNKMTVIGIHTPKPDIIKANFPGLLMQCKAYRPYSCDVKVACASTQPLDPQGVGTAEGDCAPEDVFNPILYKAITNVGMSQLEARLTYMITTSLGTEDVVGQSVEVDVDSFVSGNDDFPVYYGLLSNCHGWKTADPQSGFQMTGLRPMVYEMLANVGDTNNINRFSFPADDGAGNPNGVFQQIRGNAKPLPFINCTYYTGTGGSAPVPGFALPDGATGTGLIRNQSSDVPWINCLCGVVIVPPSRLHELFYRMVVEWTIEFTSVRPISEITNWTGLGIIGGFSHYQNYSFESTKKALGVDSEIMDNDSCMVSTNADIKKVM